MRKRLSEALAPVPLVAALTLGQLPLFVAWAGLTPAAPGPGYWPPAAGTVALNVVASVTFIRAVQISPLSATIPFLSFTPVFSSLMSAGLLGENLTGRQWVGVGLVVAGAFVVNLLPGERAAHVAGALVREPGSLLMIGVALVWSLTAALDKMAMGHAPPAVHGAVQTAGVAGLLLAWLAWCGRLPELRGVGRVRGAYALALVAGTGALALQLVALTLTLVGVVESVKRAAGMASSVVAGRLMFSEPVTSGKLAGITLMSVGVALVVV